MEWEECTVHSGCKGDRVEFPTWRIECVCVCVRVRVRQSSSSVSIPGILNLRVEGHLWLTNWHKETKSEFILIKFRVVSEKSE